MAKQEPQVIFMNKIDPDRVFDAWARVIAERDGCKIAIPKEEK